MAFFSRLLLALGMLCIATPAAADGVLQAERLPHARTCCAFAPRISLHLGASHVPVKITLAGSKDALGHHGYMGYDPVGENLGLIYTTRGGFIDLGHLRENADTASFLAVRLRPMLAAGRGEVTLERDESTRRVRIIKAVPPELLDDVVMKIAQRATFEASVWHEVVQYYASGKVPGGTEVYSAFTPEDLYSNLLGTYLGLRAVASPLPYDTEMDHEVASAMIALGAVPRRETNRIFDALEGKWWSAADAWPSGELAILRTFDIGPQLAPHLAPPELAPPVPPGVDPSPLILDVPALDAQGNSLTDYYRCEFLPEPKDLKRFAYAGGDSWVTGADLPRIAAGIQATTEAAAATRARLAPADPDHIAKTALTHYLNGIRLIQLDARGGFLTGPDDRKPLGLFGGSFTGVTADTRNGDFAFASFDLAGSRERGLIAGFSLFHANAVWFCHDAEGGTLLPPLVSLLAPCTGHEMLGLGGNVFEGLHDGRTGRTALRPIAAYGVFNPLRNGQSESYQRVRLLLRGGGDIEHFWTVQEHATTIGRVGGGAVVLARSASGHFEASGGSHYLIDPGATEDAVLQTKAALRYNFLMGEKPAKASAESVDPWGVASVGVVGGYDYASRPLHSFPDAETPFMSADHQSTWQVLVTASLGFEGLAF